MGDIKKYNVIGHDPKPYWGYHNFMQKYIFAESKEEAIAKYHEETGNKYTYRVSCEFLYNLTKKEHPVHKGWYNFSVHGGYVDHGRHEAGGQYWARTEEDAVEQFIEEHGEKYRGCLFKIL